MKKSLLLILAVFSFTFANAQGFRFGVKGGGNYSSFSGGDKDNFGEPDYKFGYHLGLTSLYEFDSDGFLGIKPELYYITKGFQVNSEIPATGLTNRYEIESKRTLGYISLPVLLNINAGGLFFELGPEFAYMVNSLNETKVSEYGSDGSKVGQTKEEEQTSKEDLSSFDIGYVAGLGYMSDMGLSIGVRYNGGLMGIVDTKDSDNEKAIKNSVFMVSVGYLFGGK
jgi:hypothetical protein